MTKISIIVPCYNVEKLVGRCLDSLLGQTLPDIEIICIDDKSTDNTLGILKQYADADKRVSIIEMPENRGVAVARNMGLAAAKSPYIGFIDPDDWVDADFYEKLYAAIAKSGADVAKATVKITNMQNKKSYIDDLNERIKQNRLVWTYQFWSGLYNHDFLSKNNINFPDEVITGQDSVFLTHVTLCTDNIVLVNDTYYHYFLLNDGSLDSEFLSRRKSQSKLDMIKHKLRLIHNANLTDEQKTEFIKYQVIPNICYEIKKRFRYKPHKRQMFDMLYQYNKNPEYQDIIRPGLGRRLYEELGQNKMFKHKSEKLFHKERMPDGRRNIYVLGKRVWSYKKSKKKLADLNKKELTKLLWEQFYKKTGKKPTDELTTLAEKVIWASMFDVTDLKVQCTDKIAVRDYVAKTVGEKYLPKLYAVYDNETQVNLDDLPDKFLLTHNAGANSEQTMLVWDKSKLDAADVKNTVAQWLKFNLAEIGYEMQYLPIKPRVMARELLDIRTDVEYKLWCFGGRVEFVCQNNYAHGHDTIGFATYDKNWNKLDFWQKLDNSYQVQKKVQKPKFLNEMIEVAEKLAKPFNFVRVDFYETVDGKLMFGELTFSPSAGNLVYEPYNDAIQKKYGALFKLPPHDKNGFAIRNK